MAPTHEFISKIKGAFQKGLPGQEAHQLMDPMPKGTRKWDHDGVAPKQSAVLILLFQEQDQWKFPLIRRPKYDGVHSGQIALPGGKLEEQDLDLIGTALRETEEEIGVRREDIMVIGALSEIYIPPSNFNILPVVGFSAKRLSYVPEKNEVDAIFDVAIDSLLDIECRQKKEIRLSSNMKMNVPCFLFGDKMVWGATAMILSEFSMLIEKMKYE